MEMTGEQLIPARQSDTWAALNDPEFLKQCVPGCESIDRVTDTEYTVHMTARVGPVSAKFRGRMLLSDIVPPESYTLVFEGQGGVAGFAKGSAQVSLAPEQVHGKPGTKLSYRVKANVGGKLAQVGSRLIDAAANKVAGDFFRAFNERLAEFHAPATLHEEVHAGPIPRDEDLPDLPASSLAFFAAASLVVFVVALFSLF
jgi:carbon monoxide dehydrogenase subunit G